MDSLSLSRIKASLVSEAYLERMLASRVPFTEVAMGMLLWIGLVLGVVREVDGALWLLSSLMGVPLMLRLARRATAGPSSSMIAWLGVFSIPAAAISAFSFVGPAGFRFMMSLPWLAVTILIGLTGLFRLLSRRSLAETMAALDIGLMLVAAAGLMFSVKTLGSAGPVGVGVLPLIFALPAITAETVRPREGSWRTPALLTLVFLGSAIFSGAGGEVGLGASGLFFAACLSLSLWLIRLGQGQPSFVQLPLMLGGVALGFGSGVLAMVRALNYFDLQGDASKLFEPVDSVVLGAGVVVPALVGLNLLLPDSVKNRRRTFLHLGAPTAEQLSRLLEEVEGQRVEAELNPLVTEAPEGYRLQRSTRDIPDFENSCEALWTWAGHEAGGIDILPEQPPIIVGRTMVFTIPVGPISLTAAARVVALISDEDHYGFVYSMLDHHPMAAVEAIMLDKSSGTPTITVSTVWRSTSVLATILGPLGNLLLRRVARRYMDGIAVAEAATIGARMLDVMSEMNKQQYAVSRDAIMAESAAIQKAALAEVEVTTQPLSEFEALFAKGFDTPDENMFEDGRALDG